MKRLGVEHVGTKQTTLHGSYSSSELGPVARLSKDPVGTSTPHMGKTEPPSWTGHSLPASSTYKE